MRRSLWHRARSGRINNGIRKTIKSINRSAPALRRSLEEADRQWSLGRRRRARELGELALQAAERSGDPMLEADARLSLVRVLFGESALSKAREHVERVIELSAERDPAREANAQIWLAIIGVHMGEPGAVRHARRGVMLAEQSGDASLIGLAHAQLGVVLVERALHDDARAALTFALRAAEQLGEPTNECRVLVYSSMLELDRGRPLQASFWLAKAQRISARIDHRVARGMVAGSLGVAHLYRGYTRAAREALIEADLLLEDVGNRHARTTFLAFLAAAEALMGHPNEARAALAQARELVGQGDETHYAAHIVDLLACVPELVQGGNLDVARARLLAVEQGDPSPASGWADLRVAAAIVRRIALGDRPRLPVTEARPGLVVAHDAMWFRLESSHAVDLSRRAVLRRLLDRLVRERLEAPGSPLPRSELIAAAWPDAKNVRSRTFSNRLHVALSTLRSLGLRSVLVSSAEGHRLREDVELTRELPAP